LCFFYFNFLAPAVSQILGVLNLYWGGGLRTLHAPWRRKFCIARKASISQYFF